MSRRNPHGYDLYRVGVNNGGKSYGWQGFTGTMDHPYPEQKRIPRRTRSDFEKTKWWVKMLEYRRNHNGKNPPHIMRGF